MSSYQYRKSHCGDKIKSILSKGPDLYTINLICCLRCDEWIFWYKRTGEWTKNAWVTSALILQPYLTRTLLVSLQMTWVTARVCLVLDNAWSAEICSLWLITTGIWTKTSSEVLTVPADVLVPLGIRTSAGTVFLVSTHSFRVTTLA